MKAKIEALNKSYLVEFKDEDQFVSFLTQHNDKINNVEVINEESLPELQKPVEVAKPSMSDGWKTLEKSAFTQKEKGVEKKGMTLGGKYAEFKYEPDKTLDNAADSKVSEPKNDSPALKGDAPEASSVEEAPKAEESKGESSKTEEKKEEPKEEKEEKKEEIKESVEELSPEEDYKEGYLIGQEAYDEGHYIPADESDPSSEEFEKGYEDGYNDAKAGINKFDDGEGEHHGPFDEEEYTGELDEVMEAAGVVEEDGYVANFGKLVGGKGTLNDYGAWLDYDYNANKSDELKSLKTIANNASKLKMTGDSRTDRRYDVYPVRFNHEIINKVHELEEKARNGKEDLISLYKQVSELFKEDFVGVFHFMKRFLGMHEQWQPNWIDESDWGKFADSCAAGCILNAGAEWYRKKNRKNRKKIKENNIDEELNEVLEAAGVESETTEENEKTEKLNEDWMAEWKARQADTVKDLIAKLQKCDPNAKIICSDKPGRGAMQCAVYTGFANKWGQLSETQDEEYNIPAVELTADL